MLTILLQAIWFIAPAGVANMVPVGAAKLFPRFEFPLDFNLTFRGKRVFGKHKTVRGLLFGVISAVLIVYLQKYLYNTFAFVQSISLADYSELNYMFGITMGTGALVGDAIKSFFKRQLNIAPGKVWFPFDQLDWIAGTVIFAYPFVHLTLKMSFFLLILGVILHMFGKLIGYVCKINETPI